MAETAAQSLAPEWSATESGVQPDPEVAASAQRASDAPYTGHIFAFITCSRVKWEATVAEYAAMTGKSEAEVRSDWEDESDFYPESDTIRLEDAMEEDGWVDRAWSPRVLHDSRNDVRPVVDVDLSDRETLQEEITDALGWLEGGYEDNGDGTFYASESYRPYDEPWDYSYALHFTHKYLGADGYVEAPWHPVTDGGFTL